MIQAEILAPENIPLAEVEGRIRDLVKNFKEGRSQESRSETNRLINEMRGIIKALLQKNQSLIMEEIDTAEEWGHVGRITEEKTNLRSIRNQDEVGKATMGHTENPIFGCGMGLGVPNIIIRRFALSEILAKRQGAVRQEEGKYSQLWISRKSLQRSQEGGDHFPVGAR